MRVLNVNVLLDPVCGGGTAERMLQLVRAFGQAGLNCSVLTLDIGLTPERRMELAGVELHAVPCLNRRFFIPQISAGALRQMVSSADIVHIMGHWTLLNILVYQAARILGKPYVVCPAGALGIMGRSPVLKRLYNLAVGRRLIRNASGHIAITAGEIPQFMEYGVAPGKVVVIPHGITEPPPHAADCAAFLARHRLQGRRFVLFMGRLSYIKGPDLLLEAFADVADRLPEHDLVFAGPDDGMLPVLHKIAARRGVANRVHFLGYVGGEDKACAYLCCDFLAIPSRKEAMSLVVLEAGIHGRPVLLTDECGFNEVEVAGGGKVVAARREGLADGLLALAADREQLLRSGQALRRFIRERYTWERAREAHLRLFQQIRPGS